MIYGAGGATKAHRVCKKVSVDMDELHRKVTTLPCSEAVLSHHHFQPTCCCVMTAYVMRKELDNNDLFITSYLSPLPFALPMLVLVLLTSNDRVKLMTNSNNVAFKRQHSDVFVAPLWQSSTISAS